MIKTLLRRKDIILNTSHVFVNKGLNAVVPALLIPFLTKVYGVEDYGVLIYIQSVMILLMFTTDYGFNLTGTRDVSFHQHEPSHLSKTVSSILVVKFLLAGCCYLLLFGYLYFIDISWDQALLYILTFTAFALQSFTPYWFFQGIKANWLITTINLVSKAVLLVLVLGFIDENSPLLSVPLAESVSYGLSFVLSIAAIVLFLRVKFSWPAWKLIGGQLQSGRHIFFFSIFNWMITGGCIIAVEYYLTSTDLGYFATFSRLMYFAFAAVQPINIAIFPYISGKAHLPAAESLKYINAAFRIYGVLVVLFLLGASFLAEPLFKQFFDKSFNDGLAPYMHAFYLMCVWEAMVMINYFIGLQVLVALGHDKIYSRYYFINTFIALAGFLIFIPAFGVVGAPFSLMLGELILFAFLFSAYKSLALRKS